MVQFYRNIKSGTMNRCQALRQAILKEKEIVRKRYGHDNPRYWGAFVFMGQP
jgi:CHAT domain-containing protein